MKRIIYHGYDTVTILSKPKFNESFGQKGAETVTVRGENGSNYEVALDCLSAISPSEVESLAEKFFSNYGRSCFHWRHNWAYFSQNKDTSIWRRWIDFIKSKREIK